jgi:hypothetical protein
MKVTRRERGKERNPVLTKEGNGQMWTKMAVIKKYIQLLAQMQNGRVTE